jgi:hypothetical protein
MQQLLLPRLLLLLLPHLLLLLPLLPRHQRTDFFLFGAASSASPFSRFTASPRSRSVSTPRLQHDRMQHMHVKIVRCR